MKSPNTYGKWEYGYFSQDQLETAGAYRVDTLLDDDPVFPDGGYTSAEIAGVYETELEALDEHYEGDT